MSKPTFTPGPWVTVRNGYIVPADHAKRAIGGADDPEVHRREYAQQIATVYHDRLGRGDREANARLIAAAPDMREALGEAERQIEYLHDKFSETGSGNAVLARIRAALAKAEGTAA